MSTTKVLKAVEPWRWRDGTAHHNFVVLPWNHPKIKKLFQRVLKKWYSFGYWIKGKNLARNRASHQKSVGWDSGAGGASSVPWVLLDCIPLVKFFSAAPFLHYCRCILDLVMFSGAKSILKHLLFDLSVKASTNKLEASSRPILVLSALSWTKMA